MPGECGVVGQRMRREEIGLDGWRNKRQATVRGLHSQESTRLPEVDEIDGRAELRFEAAPRIEEGDWIQDSVAQHTDIDVAVATRLIPSVASVQPDSQHAPVRKGLGEFPKQRVGKTGESDHVKHHIWAERDGCSREAPHRGLARGILTVSPDFRPRLFCEGELPNNAAAAGNVVPDHEAVEFLAGREEDAALGRLRELVGELDVFP